VIQIPGYLIKREIGAGGMATVYLAVQTSLEREVALKVMNPAMVSDATFSRRFMQEARTLASLAHPNIVAVYDVGITDEKLHYFSMQHLPHGDFLHRIRDGISEREVLRVVAGVARALGYAHQRGFVHRDVAPGNVLFDVNGNPVLTDFGIARAVSKTSRITNAGVSVGTSHYMSPEQARGGDVDGRSDLYSLGAVTYEALTGHAPYEGDDGFAIAYAHVFEPIPRLPEHFAHWQEFIDRAMAKDAAQRFQNADELLAALGVVEHHLSPEAAVATMPVTGVQPTLNMNAPTLAMPRPAGLAEAAETRQLPQPNPSQENVAEQLRQLRDRQGSAPTMRLPAASAAEVVAVPAPARAPIPAWIWAALGAAVLLLIAAGAAYRYWPAASSSSPSPAAVAPSPGAAETVAASDEPQPGASPEVVSAPVEATPGEGEVVDEPDALEAMGIDAADADANLRLALETTVVEPVPELLRLARADLAARRLTQPPGRSASDRFRIALRIDPDNAAAKAGLVETAKALLAVAEAQFSAGQYDEYFAVGARAIEIAGVHDGEGAVRAVVEGRRKQLIDTALSEGDAAFARWEGMAAAAAYRRVLALDPRHEAALRGLARSEGLGQPGFVFSDRIGDAQGPELMIMRMGGKRLAVARNETTVAEFTRFWRSGAAAALAARPACRDRESIFRSSKTRTWQSPGFSQDGNHPVVCVAYLDAETYAAWLSRQSGHRYRLLSAAEWTALASHPIDSANCRANVADSVFNAEHRDRQSLPCSDGFAATAPVRRYDAPGGLYDLAGNVREWVSDCGSNCASRVAMGSAWSSTADKIDPRQRDSFDADTGFNTIGFRVAREID
jgi:serine/threonine protein kinase